MLPAVSATVGFSISTGDPLIQGRFDGTVGRVVEADEAITVARGSGFRRTRSIELLMFNREERPDPVRCTFLPFTGLQAPGPLGGEFRAADLPAGGRLRGAVDASAARRIPGRN